MPNRFVGRHTAAGVSLPGFCLPNCFSVSLCFSVGMALCLVASGDALAQSRNYEDPDESKPAWQDSSSVTLPAAPQAVDLLPFFVSATASQQFQIDAKSLVITSEGVVRYTLVGTSSSGVKNVSYEGIRCATFEYKTYAYGRADGSWSSARRDQWQRILHNISNRAQAALALDFFCQGKTVAGKVPEMLQKIRNEQVK